MSDPTDQNADQAASSAPNAYERLGIEADASFDAVQAARQARLEEAGDDPLARSRVEAAYDAVLMDRLKERQQGRVSTAARSASAREQQQAAPASRLPMPPLPRMPLPRVAAPSLAAPSLSLAEGTDRWLALGGSGVLLALLLLLPAPPAELLLALATALCVVCLQRRRRRFLPAVGWGFGLLALGLLLGGVLVAAAPASLPLGLPLTVQQVQSLPALILLLLGSLLVA
ncbi:MAG: CPP1-like family protein [Cyanobacteriota bacterium]|nr:CPP1-like family protein [Cyanobacteriota bacterium]